MQLAPLAAAIALALVGCSSADDATPAIEGDGGADAAHAVDGAPDAASTLDAGAGDAHDAASDAVACAVFGAPGECMTASACAAIPDHSGYTGHCPTASQECCIDTPDVADNPPVPTGYKLLAQSQVTPEMTTWAVTILHDTVTYPMFSTTTKVFGTLTVLARVEWHPPDFQNGVVHRGVTLYEPI